MTPRPLDDGAKAGWGLVAFITAVTWGAAAFTVAVLAWALEKRRGS